MKRFTYWSATVTLQASAAWAQDVGASMTVPGLNLQVHIQGPGPGQPAPAPAAPSATRVETVTSDGYEVRYEDARETKFQVLAPEGATCEVWQSQREKGTFTIPFTIRPRADQFYRFVVYLPDGSIFDKKLEMRGGQMGRLRVTAGSSPTTAIPTAPVVTSTPAPPPPVAAPSLADVDALLAAINAETFSSDKLNVLRTSEGGLTVDGLGRLVDAFTHSSDKVEVVEIGRSRLVDPKNGFKLYSHFTFSSDKERVKELLGK